MSTYLPANLIPFLSLSSLIFPLLVLVNIFFVLYWLINLKKQIFISLLILLLNYNNLQALYQWNGKHPIEPKGFALMSYNVRLFNAYNWIKQKGIDVEISNYIKDQNPGILCLQEYKTDKQTDFSQYKFKHIVLKGTKRKTGLAIYSHYKIINRGNLDFPDTYNNAIWADIVIGKDTLRLYNIHLQSFKIVNPEDLVEQNKLKTGKKLQKVFAEQEKQARKIQAHIAKTRYPVIISGDFNNTAFSSIYRILKQGKNDALVQAGEGFGFTWRYKWLPLRIDFILTDENKIEILKFNTLDHIKYSDHFPIKAILSFKNEFYEKP
jgi:endonuclease/exonuclease/phosphatase family metal-dependent hydrolase